MSQDLIGCRKRRKFKALIPRVVVFVNDPSSEERRIDFYCFMVFLSVLWFYGHTVVHIFSGFALYGTNVNVSRS